MKKQSGHFHDCCPNVDRADQYICDPLSKNPPFSQKKKKNVSYKNTLNCNGELYTCLKKNYTQFNCIDIEKTLLKRTKTRHHWTFQLIRSTKILGAGRRK